MTTESCMTGDSEDPKVIRLERMRAGRQRAAAMAREAKVHQAKQKHMTFVTEYLRNGQNGTKAAIAAGYAPTAAAKASSRPLKLDHVRTLIDDARAEGMAEAGVSAKYVIGRLKLEAETSKVDSARVKALELLGRIAGAYAPDRLDQTVETHSFWSQEQTAVESGSATAGDDEED